MTDLSKDNCSECGHRINLKRIDGHYVFQEIRSVASFEKGFLFTLKELATNPGDSVKEFLIFSKPF